MGHKIFFGLILIGLMFSQCLTQNTTASKNFTLPNPTQNKSESEAFHLKEDQTDFYTSLISSFSLIFVSEIGDKTFFLVMIYSLSNSIIKTFIINAFAMSFMTLAAVIIGASFSLFINKTIINWIAFFLFAIFAGKMFHSAATKESKSIEEKFQKKLSKMEREKQKQDEKNADLKDQKKDLETPLIDDGKSKSGLFESVWPFIFALTIGELGDGSQVATVVMAAAQNFYGVLLGGCLAHMCCSLVAMIFGHFLGKHLSTRQILISGGVVFTIFAITYLFEIFGYCLF
jgi:putative Ca2+/H+ antiporter (TMEM165/GDT1 family)